MNISVTKDLENLVYTNNIQNTHTHVFVCESLYVIFLLCETFLYTRNCIQEMQSLREKERLLTNKEVEVTRTFEQF